MAKSKFITITGTNTGVGTTTIANYVAVELAKRNHITLLIEFKTRTGLSVYMQKGLHESRRSLSEVMSFPEKLNQNTIRSSHDTKLRYLCMNFKDDNLKMRNYQPTNITQIITKAKKYFEYVILDLPADNLESTVTPLVMGRDFIHKPDHQIIVMDESACSMKYLNDLDNTMYMVDGQGNRDTTFILNRVEASHYHDYILEYLPSLSVSKVSNLVYLPTIEGLTVLCNSGNIYKMGFCDSDGFDITADKWNNIMAGGEKDSMTSISPSFIIFDGDPIQQALILQGMYGGKIKIIIVPEEQQEAKRLEWGLVDEDGNSINSPNFVDNTKTIEEKQEQLRQSIEEAQQAENEEIDGVIQKIENGEIDTTTEDDTSSLQTIDPITTQSPAEQPSN